MRELLPFKRSFSFERHLVKGKEASPGKLPDKIDMSQFTPFMDRLYGVSKQGYVIADPEKRNFEIEYARRGKNRDVNPESPAEMQAFIEWIERKGVGERTSVIYFDQADSQFKMWEIQYGDVFEAKTQYPPRAEGILPVLEIHTHPDNSFFSPEDLQRLRHKEKEGRKAKAAIVLCPDIQFMVVSTSATYKFHIPFSTIFEVNDEHEIFIEAEVPYGKTLNRYSYQLRRVEDKIGSHLMDEEDDFWIDLHRRKNSGEITQEEADLLVEADNKRREDILNEKKKRLDGIYSRLERKVLARKAQNQERLLVQNAKKHNLEVYFSTDRAHFTKMDAIPEFILNKTA